MTSTPFSSTFAGRKVLVTGHTGFCGSWLSMWLRDLGADVYGFSRAPITDPALFDLLPGWDDGHSIIGDIEDFDALNKAVQTVQPEIIFHLAAQALVRESYADTLGTYRTNVIGTANLLEAVRHCATVRATVAITTDKVYENREWVHPYREGDELGGKDPYSASKAASELVISSYRRTVLDGSKTLVASARGGNIIGGGDWSADRLLPDIVRAIQSGSTLHLRNPNATRPWQHVLALCHGYLQLGSALVEKGAPAASAWNFGPTDNTVMTTSEIVDAFGQHWKRPNVEVEASQLIEAQQLALDSTKARVELGWKPGWNTTETIEKTVEWYAAFDKGADVHKLCAAQLAEYCARIA
ncbi:MAG: CDP-glucose 4,6-dehydratase [Pseudomonadota bacterium]